MAQSVQGQKVASARNSRDWRFSFATCTKTAKSIAADPLLQNVPGLSSATLRQWNGDAVSDIVRDVARRAKAINPRVIVSADLHLLNTALAFEGQDVVRWIDSGRVDVAFQMDCRPISMSRSPAGTRSAGRSPQDVLISSLFDRFDHHVREIRDLWARPGVAFYHYVQLSDPQVATLDDNVFSMPVTPAWR